ncbi:pyridoxamine 5'-phosphate oxidase family protein [Telmatocola sphagniphila]|uniref:Pyridoxamine 5'-phosphate oxidase family protein n=1 Tax=Telmatocola sphagniphila TaxID=1123043 RepID=A0A8E6B9U9_9BACT|nr:pyridoxamine 5'-phosphate oxidase family protein [Telmatocola sphagniphila]QVL34037.1 pyridoxamine 5'-phosphate oxidase family protein [Telmatocola sphagniphila]
MKIRELSREECLQMLARTRLARLACLQADQPYVVPVYLAFDGLSDSLCGFTIPGQKLEWLRENPKVCVEVEKITSYDQWITVIVFGIFEELPEVLADDTAPLQAPKRPLQVCETIPPIFVEKCLDDSLDRSNNQKRKRAWDLLKLDPMWGEPACSIWTSRANRNLGEPFHSVYYRIRIDTVSGREAVPDAFELKSDSPSPNRRQNWISRTLVRLIGKNSEHVA